MRYTSLIHDLCHATHSVCHCASLPRDGRTIKHARLSLLVAAPQPWLQWVYFKACHCMSPAVGQWAIRMMQKLQVEHRDEIFVASIVKSSLYNIVISTDKYAPWVNQLPCAAVSLFVILLWKCRQRILGCRSECRCPLENFQRSLSKDDRF